MSNFIKFACLLAVVAISMFALTEAVPAPDPGYYGYYSHYGKNHYGNYYKGYYGGHGGGHHGDYYGGYY